SSVAPMAASANDASQLSLPITDVQVGMAVPRVGNPDGEFDEQFGIEVELESWRLLRLKAEKKDGSYADVTLLRPVGWLYEQTQPALDDQEADDELGIDLVPLTDANFPGEFALGELMLLSPSEVARIEISVDSNDPNSSPAAPRPPPAGFDSRVLIGQKIP